MWRFIVSCVLLFSSAQLFASDDDWQQFERCQNAVKKFNFDVSYVQVRANQLITYRWLHGFHQQGGALPIQTELEQLIPQDGIGTDTFRRNNRVYYATPDAPLVVTLNSTIKELPAILFQPVATMQKLYEAVPGSSASLSGRTAKLLRLSARDASRYSYWLWFDAETGFPLRVDTVDAQNAVLERWMVVHMQLKPALPQELLTLMSADLPEQPVALPTTDSAVSPLFQLAWLPNGYQLISQHQPVSTRSGRVLASWLISDGLHQISVFVQPTAGMPGQTFQDGATTMLVAPKQNYDVTVIGPVTAEIAGQLANAVQ